MKIYKLIYFDEDELEKELILKNLNQILLKKININIKLYTKIKYIHYKIYLKLLKIKMKT